MKGILKVLLLLVLILIILISGVYIFQEKFIFLPKGLDNEYTFNFPSLSSQVTFEELFINTEEEGRINALYFKVDNPNGLVVYFHGNAHNLSKWGTIASQFTQHDFNVIMMDYRGYGKSTGKRTEKNMYTDAQAFYLQAKDLFPELFITVYGRSLGTTFATYVASKNNPRKLILESPFYSLTDVVKTRYPFLPAESFLKYNFNTATFVNNVDANVTIFHGTEDGIVPFSSGEKLFKVFPVNTRKMIEVPGGEHNNLATFPEFALRLRGELKY